jgi:hypothetical protein
MMLLQNRWSTAKVALLGGALTSVVIAAQSSNSSQASITLAAQEVAFAKGGLQAAAAITGSYTRPVQERWEGDPLSLTELADLSAVIVIGTPYRATCHLARDGRSVETAFTVDVETIVKGSGGAASVRVFVPGGKAGFVDGTTAIVRTPDFLRPQIGATSSVAAAWEFTIWTSMCAAAASWCRPEDLTLRWLAT